MPLNRMNPFELLVDDHHGQYVGQIFAGCIKRECFPTISAEDWHILETGPEHEYYDETCAALDQHESTTGASLYWMDGGLWAVDWSHIGDPDDIHDVGAIAYGLLKDNHDAWELFCDLRAALYDGPDCGTWTDSRLSKLRDSVYDICQTCASDLPLYWHSDYGIEEISIDVESLLMAESPSLKEIASYW
jgi:hypothetical protein